MLFPTGKVEAVPTTVYKRLEFFSIVAFLDYLGTGSKCSQTKANKYMRSVPNKVIPNL